MNSTTIVEHIENFIERVKKLEDAVKPVADLAAPGLVERIEMLETKVESLLSVLAKFGGTGGETSGTVTSGGFVSSGGSF